MELLAGAGFAGLAGCTGQGGGDGDGGATPSGDRTGGRLTAGWFTGSIDVMDPPFISVGQYFQLASNVFNGLVMLEKDLTVRGDLAKNWTVEDDGTTYTFQLREDVTFHNGEAFTAEDVEYSIRRTIEEEAPAAPKLGSLQPVDEGGVEVVDEYTVRLNLEEPNAVMLIYLTRGPGRAAVVVNRTAIEEMGQEQYQVTPVGTGPFELTDHEVGSRVTLDAFDDYFKTDEEGTQLPYLDGVDVEPIPEAATIVNALRSGDIDFANQVPLQNLGRVEQDDSVRKLSAPGINWLGFAMNENREPFDDVTVRQGLAKIIDNEAFVETAYFGNALPDTGVIHSAAGWVWRDQDGKPDHQQHAPDEGRRLLAEAGAADASFSILVQEGDLRAAKAMRQQLTEAGLDVDLDQVTSSTYWERYANRDYDTTISGSIIDPDPEQSLWNFYRLPDEDGVWNWVDYENEEVHELLADQRRATDPEQRKQLLWEIEDILIEEVPHAYLLHQDDVAARRPNVEGFVHVPGMRYLETTWLDE